MNVSSIASSLSQANPQEMEHLQRSKEMQALKNDLQAGNLAGAQQDFAALQQAVQNAGQPSAGSQGMNPTGKDFHSLQSALRAGDITSAKQALAAQSKNLPQANQANGQHHHSHHHAGGSVAHGGQHTQSPAVSGLLA